MPGETDQRRIIYRIDAAGRLDFVNRAWLDFARENDAPELTAAYVLGQPLERFIAGWEVRHLYDLVYARVRRTRREIALPFACDAPDRRRAFLLRILPLENDALEFVTEALRIETAPPRPVLDRRVERSPQVVVICSWCKRLRFESSGWVVIEEAPEKEKLITEPPSLTHGVCPDCLAGIRRQIDEPDR